MFDNRPIGVFDSGVGGLTVLQALHVKLPKESTVYLGDLARCPYGPRPQAEVRDFALQIADLLRECDIKLLVVACNTATAAAFDELRDRYAFPVVGVVVPGAEAALRLSCSGRIGVIATDGTVRSGAYPRAIHRASPGTMVVQRAASWLVPMIEQGVLARGRVARDLEPTLIELCAEGIDTLILGCTHFPLIRDIFEAEVGSEVQVVDSAVTASQEVHRLLVQRAMQADRPATHRLLVTGPAEAFSERAQAMFHTSPRIETVDLLAGYAR